MSTSTTSTLAALAPPRAGRSYDAYTIHTPAREVAPGIMDDGTLSTNHPLVQQFLAYTVRKALLLETAARAHTRASAEQEAAAALARSLKRRKPSTKSKSKSKNEASQAKSEEKAKAKVEATVAHWHGQHKHPRVTRWRCMHGGIARVADVHAALGPGVPDYVAEAVFALAALSVYSFWHCVKLCLWDRCLHFLSSLVVFFHFGFPSPSSHRFGFFSPGRRTTAAGRCACI